MIASYRTRKGIISEAQKDCQSALTIAGTPKSELEERIPVGSHGNVSTATQFT